ncbi:carotenoid 1,2-hydratase [Acuticoccus kandeliae]|uniref:carotenoid 1,2-hydratase n=1 Tax=Acuticoccus kandeliae TaxID=2073160 RepID=UPI00196A9AE9|nr:carotenoid 1,2-hydratase [Acuticoccus kandeliae]
MTERGAAAVTRGDDHLAIGPSSLRWEGDALVARVEERATPIPRRAEGTIRIIPESANPHPFALSKDGAHVWHPTAPTARIEVRMRAPAVSWSGRAYLDMNWGDAPLEAGFRRWHWSRSHLGKRCVVFYEAVGRDGGSSDLAVRFDAAGRAEAIEPPPVRHLRRTNWLLPRRTRSDDPDGARITRTLEDTPFYTRSIVGMRLFGEAAETIHESVDLDRFASRWVQALLPYRMPRRPT